MTKKLKLSYILFFVFSGILVAWTTLTRFFSGVGINFLGILGLLFAVFVLCLIDKSLFKRVLDLLVVGVTFVIFELIVYFACEFGQGLFISGFEIYQNVLSFFGLLFLAYIGVRFVFDLIGKQIKFVEILLGNVKPTSRNKKEKNAKEVSNGCLQEKPNSIQNNEKKEVSITEETSENNSSETEVVIETEE